jgi:uncharacterized protein
LLAPTPDMVCIEDIAYALAHINRFTGHAGTYSVAEHSIRVSYACDPEDALAGLLHDASEAYVGDLASPIKHLPEMGAYRALEAYAFGAICAALGVTAFYGKPDSVRKADMVLLATECRDLMGGQRGGDWELPYPPLPDVIVPLPADIAERWFLERYFELKGAPSR